MADLVRVRLNMMDAHGLDRTAAAQDEGIL